MKYLGFFRSYKPTVGYRTCMFEKPNGSILFVNTGTGTSSTYINWKDAQNHIPHGAKVTIIREPAQLFQPQ